MTENAFFCHVYPHRLCYLKTSNLGFEGFPPVTPGNNRYYVSGSKFCSHVSAKYVLKIQKSFLCVGSCRYVGTHGHAYKMSYDDKVKRYLQNGIINV